MARASKVKGIKPKESLGENARRIVAVRLGEMLSWRAALDDPAQISELHNMRIAAKRLRYALEMFDVCFPKVKPLLKELSGIQDDLGDIHDLDVLVEILRSRLATLDGTLEGQAAQLMRTGSDAGARSNALRQLLYGQARNTRRLGLLGLLADKVVEREKRFLAFQKQWGGMALDEFGLRVREVAGLVGGPPQDDSQEVDAPSQAPVPVAADG
jgi:hypothetical protein